MKRIKELILKKESIEIYGLSLIYSLLLVFGYCYEKDGDAGLIFENPLNMIISVLIFMVFFFVFKIFNKL